MVDIVLIMSREILSWSLKGVKGLNYIQYSVKPAIHGPPIRETPVSENNNFSSSDFSLNPLKCHQHLISPYSNTAESFFEITRTK